MIAQNVDTIKQFFGKILPKNSENYYITISTKNKETKMVTNKPFHINEIDKIAKYCIDSNELCHVYFGLGLLSSPTKGNKRATNDTVSCLTGFWADIDYGNEGHSKNNLPPTYDDAILLLDGIEKPSVTVSTGGGIHAYWIFNEPIMIDDSNRDYIANSLKCFQTSIIQNGISYGWAVDNTANLAQMLRVPETINYKYNKLTSIVETTDIKYDSKLFCNDYTDKFSLCKMQNNNYDKEEIAGTDYIADICDYNSISEYFLLKTGCKWINYCETNSYNLSEPEWYAMLSIVSRIDSGRQHCHDISKNYSNYSYDETENKIQQAQEKGGPFTCTYIKNTFENNVCKHCPFNNLISSPIQLSKKDVLNLNRSKFIEFNSEHAAISIAGKSLIINYNEIDQLSGLKTFSLSSYDDFNKRYLPVHGKYINKKGEIVEEKFTKLWLNSSYIKDFPNGIIFSPTEDIKGAYNLWQGFAVQPKETGDWSLYKNHIMEVICDNKPEFYNYVFAWMANIVQNLGKNRPGTAIVLRGERGTGKSIFADIFGNIFGGHYMTVTQKNHLVGKFNNHLCNKVLVFADEAIYSGDKESNEILKTLITGPTLTVEKKGIDAVVVPNNISLIIAGNNNELVNAGTSERRYLVLELSNIHKQDHQYFKNMIDQMENGGYEKMLYDLQKYDIGIVNLRNVPKTAYLFDQLLGAWHDKPVHKFTFEYLTENIHFIEKDNNEIKTNELYDNFLEWAKTNKAKVVDKSNFQKLFKKLTGSEVKPKGSNKEKFAILQSLEYSRGL